MRAQQIAVAKDSLQASHDGSLTFPEICRNLIAAGFEGYLVDYRTSAATYYLPDGDCLTLEAPTMQGAIAAAFDQEAIATQVRWAQSQAEDYSYKAFSRNVKVAGCAGYIVSFLGRRVVYFGRTGETHVEHFPPAS